MRKSPGLRLQTSVIQDNVPVEVAAGLFVGSVHAAFNMDALKENRITHVLNLAGSYATFPEEFTYLSLSIRDKEYASLLSCLPIAAVFIDAGIKCGGVLVHCVGGRSRSPAVVMAFLMMKHQLSFKTLSAHLKMVRPVVNLNAGFAFQLECLDTSHGDIFAAHQKVLQARLAHLTQLSKDGELLHELVRKRRRTRNSDASLRSPPQSLTKKQSSLELLASGCDDRGMVSETVPSGFCLSLPSCVSSTHAPAASASTSFIPALRSMGTMFGCQVCGENLFCAGDIVRDASEQATEGKLSAKVDHGNGDDDAFLAILRGLKSKVPSDGSESSGKSVETFRKRPLLSKLHLRSHSPRASTTAGSVPLTAIPTESSFQCRKSISSNHALVKPGGHNVLKTPKFGRYQEMKLQKDPQDPVAGESDLIIKNASLSRSCVNGVGANRKAGGSMEGLWRSFTSLSAPKRTIKESIYGKKPGIQLQAPSEGTEVQKPCARSAFSRTPFLAAANCTPEHAAFLKHNSATWEQRIKLLVSKSERVAAEVGEGLMSQQLAALLEADSRVLKSLTCFEQWPIDPPLWSLEQAAKESRGVIHCPRETCGAVIGEWRWGHGSGNLMTPFVVKKHAICILGNLTEQPIQLVATAGGNFSLED